MSKGYGTVQRRIASLFALDPDQTFPIRKLVGYVFGEPPYTKAQYNSVARAAEKVANNMGWMKSFRRYHRKVGLDLQTHEEFVKANPIAKGHGSASSGVK